MNVFDFKGLSLTKKIIFPLLAISIVFFGCVLILGNLYLNKQRNKEITEDLIKIHEKISHYVADKSESALITAASIAYCPYVSKAYETYYITYNLDSSYSLLSRNVYNISSSIQEIAKERVRVRFHVPPGIVLFSNWSEQKGNDISAYRNDLAAMYKDQVPRSGVAVEEDMHLVYGLHPVFDENRTLLGSIEVNFDLNIALQSVVSKNDAEYILFADKLPGNLISAGHAAGLENQPADYVVIGKSSDNIKTDRVSNKINAGNIDKPIVYRVDNSAFILFPVFMDKHVNKSIVAIQKDYQEVVSSYNRVKIWGLVTMTILCLALLLIMYVIATDSIGKPVKQIIKTLSDVANGEQIRRIRVKGHDDISQIKRAINHLSENLINFENFAHEIGEGRFDASFKPRSKKDSLAFTLINMKKKLQKSKEDDERMTLEEKKRTWHSNGIAKINELIHNLSHDNTAFFNQIINQLVKLVGANQGGIFILDEDKEYALLKGCYAYDRNKYIQKKVHHKEGLIGRCILEREFLLVKDLPENYLFIESATGRLSPKYLLIVPIIRDELVLGVIEMASFNEFEQNAIDFIMETTKSISTAITDLEYKQRTQRLLEESKIKQSKLLQQEEEMRQNLEELTATQEEFERREKELTERINELEKGQK